MATQTLNDTRLQIHLDAGVDAEGKQVTKRKSFNSVKLNATADQLYAVVSALVPLQQYPLLSIERNDTSIITGP